MITIIGYTLGIPDTVMGLTFVAAGKFLLFAQFSWFVTFNNHFLGVSVPDALSSIAVIKEGYGDMVTLK